MYDSDQPVTEWIGAVKRGVDPDAEQGLWEAYFQQLQSLATGRLSNREDGEDVALSAMKSFLHRARDGQFPELKDRTELAKAGLVPALRHVAVSDRKEAHVAILRPRMRPLKSLADVLDALAGGSDEAGVSRSRQYVRDLQQTNEKGEHDGLWWIVDSLPNIGDSPFVLLVDQFEEVLTECEDETEQKQFIENLLYAASQKDGAFSLVFTLRSDFLAETQQHESLNSFIADQGVLIPGMKEAELREAIARPSQNADTNSTRRLSISLSKRATRASSIPPGTQNCRSH